MGSEEHFPQRARTVLPPTNGKRIRRHFNTRLNEVRTSGMHTASRRPFTVGGGIRDISYKYNRAIRLPLAIPTDPRKHIRARLAITTRERILNLHTTPYRVDNRP